MFTEWMNFTAIRLSGEVPKSGENVLLILNHKCNIDSMYIWSAIARVELGAVGLFKAVVKSSIKYLPIYGWGMKTAGFIYISRSWEQDRAHIKRWAQAVVKDSLACWLTIYPEGTRFTESAKVDELPEGDEQVAEWTQDAWQRKDALLYTLARTGSFPGAIHQVVALRFFVFMAMSWGGVYLLWTSSIFRWYTVFACLASMLLAIADPPEW
eukprot:gene2978-3795_t